MFISFYICSAVLSSLQTLFKTHTDRQHKEYTESITCKETEKLEHTQQVARIERNIKAEWISFLNVSSEMWDDLHVRKITLQETPPSCGVLCFILTKPMLCAHHNTPNSIRKEGGKSFEHLTVDGYRHYRVSELQWSAKRFEIFQDRGCLLNGSLSHIL